MKPGDYAKTTGLKNNPRNNGRFVEILTDLMENEVPEGDGVVRRAKRYGFRFIGSEDGAYIREENVEFVTDEPHKQRAINIHCTGMEDA